MAAKRKVSPPIVAPPPAQVPPPLPEQNWWERHARRLILVSGVIGSLGIIGTTIVIIARSDPPPLAGIDRVDNAVRDQGTINMRVLEGLRSLKSGLDTTTAQQQEEYANRQASRLRTLQNIIDGAKIRAAQTGLTADALAVDALEEERDRLQLEIMNRPGRAITGVP